MIDVGAHAGQFSKIFSHRASEGMVLALEPASYPFSILQIVKSLHRLANVKAIKMGISVKQGEAHLRTPVKPNGVVRFGLSHISNDEPVGEEQAFIEETISVTTIDKLVSQFARDHKLSLIKADIEGYEYQMLCGAEQTIEKNKPAVLMELSVNKTETLAFFYHRDYLVYTLDNYSGKSSDALRLSLKERESEISARNILAVHESEKNKLALINENFCCKN